MKELILGLDDAGRGPVIGPMVLAACLIDKKQEKEFKKLGVKDSKDITQKRREFLEVKIKESVIWFGHLLINPEVIDKSASEGLKLNELEANNFAKLINKINKGEDKIKVIVDCPSVSLKKWSDYLKTKIKDLSNLRISCEHKADSNHIAVAAASILAKCLREKEMDKLKKEYGVQIGSGYPSDPSTKRFLEKYAIKYKNKGIFRKSWATYIKALEKRKQQTLF